MLISHHEYDSLNKNHSVFKRQFFEQKADILTSLTKIRKKLRRIEKIQKTVTNHLRDFLEEKWFENQMNFSCK